MGQDRFLCIYSLFLLFLYGRDDDNPNKLERARTVDSFGEHGARCQRGPRRSPSGCDG